MSNLVGRRFGMLVVEHTVKPSKYRCVCDCGQSVEVWGKFLYEGKTDCGCVRFKEKDLTGQKFGRLVVIGPLRSNRVAQWKCRCECGKEIVVRNDSLKLRVAGSCGCLQRETASQLGKKTALALEGQRFGRLIVVARAGSRWKKSLWLCKCDCGKEKVVSARGLISGGTKSCGCYHREVWHRMLWNPDLTDEERQLQKERRHDPKTLEWRIKVYRRDGDACVICGDKRGSNLVAHHKEAWNSNKELRYDVENGTTVCKLHHKEFHYLYGYGDNTASEWNEFLVFKSGCAHVAPVRVIRRRKRVDLTGMRFDRLQVIGKDSREYYWICRCDCGVVKTIYEYALTRGTTKSCGCLQQERRIIAGRKNLNDLTGKRFGKLVPMRYLLKHRWLCKCDCGNERIVDAKFLHSGNAVDCQSSKNGQRCLLRRAA